ncbi:alpha-Mannosidase class II a [Carabus blaptoides fortunei]
MDMSFPIRTFGSSEFQDNKWLHFENRLRSLENNLNKHHETVGQIKRAINQLIPAVSSTSSSTHRLVSPNNNLDFRNLTPPYEMMYDRTCPIQVDYVPRTNIQMLELYKELKFDNPDGGVWKQGWNINYDVHQWNKQHKLKVFVVPHSHNDPGWLKTVEDYYISQTKNILNNMVTKLMEDKNRKFIWAEISYFSMWWNEIDQTTRTLVKQLVRDGQLEIVTGGWVMNDEANAHWISILHQMNEGHQWLHRNLNYTPKSSWSIDPFGQSPTMPFLLKKMGLENLLIQRIHYAVKKHLASQTQLEFNWKQLWDGSGKTDLFTHMMPFYSYDVPHTCGPDPKICCQFDFKRLPGYGVTCPWRIAPQVITDNNVAHRAELLLDQYRKKAQLYRTNVVLAPLGDDFRYDHPTEWNNQFNNYQKLFDHMNSNLKLNVEAQFGTLTDYFNAVRAEKSTEEFPVLTGDFFTYADRDDHYWSGYYTSRPFYKRMDRVLLSYIRAADIILTMASGANREGSKLVLSSEAGLTKMMREARQSLSLFQHHDGITGTARDPVVIDYGQKMLTAIVNAQLVIQQSVNVLLSGPNPNMFDSDIVHYNIDDIRRSQDSLPEKYIITIGRGAPIKRVVMYNSLTFTRHEVITLLVSTPFVQVTDLTGNLVSCQISPVFEYGTTISESRFELAFIANVPALSLVTYTIQALEKKNAPSETVMSSIRIFNHYDDVKLPNGFTDMEVTPSAREFTIQNNRVTAAFNNLGLLKAIRVGVNTLPVHLDFAKYGVRQSSERSGAYLFLPDGDAQPLTIESTTVKVIEGPILSSVIVQLPKVHHVVILYNSPGADSLGLEIQNTVDISEMSNFELVMRLSTNINSTSEFFTDLNGFQVI